MRTSSTAISAVLPMRRNSDRKPVIASSFTRAARSPSHHHLVHKSTQQAQILNPSSKKSIHWWKHVEDQLKNERRVNFDTDKIECHNDPWERNSSLEWYSEEDFVEMKQQAMSLARLAVNSSTYHMTWPRALGYAYNAFVTARAPPGFDGHNGDGD